ncbi:MAG TPA: YMGG-like glycine zipper-containing protein [Pyrinomonadaceae bacterium]
MSGTRRLIALLLAFALLSLNVAGALGQQRRTTQTTQAPAPRPRATPAPSLLTGIYRLDPRSSDDARKAAERAASNLPPDVQRRIVDNLSPRLESPEQLAIERRGNMIQIASSRAPRISFEADGRDHRERMDNGHTISTRAVLYGDQLMVSTSGSPDDEFTVTFDPVDGGRRLRVTRRIYIAQLNEPVVVQSIYNKTSSVARWGIFDESRQTARNNQTPPRRFPQPSQPSTTTTTTTTKTLPAPPVIRERVPREQPPPMDERRTGDVYVLVVPAGTQLVAVLNDDLSTELSREGDPFTMTVRGPAQFEGATLEGNVARINRSGRMTGRADMTLEFRQIRLRDGRTAPFAGYIESVRVAGGEDVRVGGENADASIEETNDQTTRTTQRAAIGAAVGAIIGAIASGGKGAAIGAAIGAGVGAGSVYAQGRDDLELLRGTELTIRAQANQ